ncbi:MAG: hypothetical protein D8M51_01600 [Ignavibacteriae bacterium]|nr:hypothetical protein [Ignavibacteriota bacterium]
MAGYHQEPTERIIKNDYKIIFRSKSYSNMRVVSLLSLMQLLIPLERTKIIEYTSRKNFDSRNEK